MCRPADYGSFSRSGIMLLSSRPWRSHESPLPLRGSSDHATLSPSNALELTCGPIQLPQHSQNRCDTSAGLLATSARQVQLIVRRHRSHASTLQQTRTVESPFGGGGGSVSGRVKRATAPQTTATPTGARYEADPATSLSRRRRAPAGGEGLALQARDDGPVYEFDYRG
jgi:hypothetical protein